MQKSSRTLFVGLFKPVIIWCSHVLTNRAQLVPLSSPPNTKHESSNVLVFSSAGANRENKKNLARLRETEACWQHFLASPAEILQGKSGHEINNLIYKSLYSVRASEWQIDRLESDARSSQTVARCCRRL